MQKNKFFRRPQFCQPIFPKNQVAYSIVKNHDGYITVMSRPGKGTTFYIYIPASREKIPEKKVLQKSLSIGKGKVLVMDDEEMVRETLTTMLKKLGCEAVCVKDGAEAITLYKQSRETGNPFDVVIMDLTIIAKPYRITESSQILRDVMMV